MKEQLVQWLSNLDYGKFFAIVIAFLSTYGAFLGALVIGIVKTRISKIKLDEALAQLEIKLTEKQIAQAEKDKQEFISILGDVQKTLITQNTQAQEKRMEILNSLEEDSKEAIQEIKKLSVDEVLDNLSK